MVLHPARDIGAQLSAQIGTVPLSDAGSTVNGTGIDRLSIDNPLSCKLVGLAGAATGTPTTQTFDLKLQDSPDDSTYADFTDASGDGAITQVAADNGVAVADVDLSAADRYIRAVSTVAFTGGSSPEWPVASAIIFGGREVVP